MLAKYQENKIKSRNEIRLTSIRMKQFRFHFCNVRQLDTYWNRNESQSFCLNSKTFVKFLLFPFSESYSLFSWVSLQNIHITYFFTWELCYNIQERFNVKHHPLLVINQSNLCVGSRANLKKYSHINLLQKVICRHISISLRWISYLHSTYLSAWVCLFYHKIYLTCHYETLFKLSSILCPFSNEDIIRRKV
jgi:hypothetical protein